MQVSSYRLADYRLAAYVVAAAVIAGAATFAADRLTAPSGKVQANGAPASSGAVRQIPIARTSAADLGDPEGKLTPVYPTSPGKDLPVKDTPVVQAATNSQPVKPVVAGTIGSGGQITAPLPAQASTAPQAASSPRAANVCNVAACASAYRSFRESDCSYQPFEGPRRTCEGAPDSNAPAAATVGRGGYDDALREAERTVRRLPRPGSYADSDDDSGVTIIETPQQRYDLRRNWINEPGD